MRIRASSASRATRSERACDLGAHLGGRSDFQLALQRTCLVDDSELIDAVEQRGDGRLLMGEATHHLERREGAIADGLAAVRQRSRLGAGGEVAQRSHGESPASEPLARAGMLAHVDARASRREADLECELQREDRGGRKDRDAERDREHECRHERADREEEAVWSAQLGADHARQSPVAHGSPEPGAIAAAHQKFDTTSVNTFSIVAGFVAS